MLVGPRVRPLRPTVLYSSDIQRAHETATIVEFPDPGSYDITAFDSHGHYDRIRISVRNDR